ncbi:acyltransferase [Gordonia shandongensis]|uniref:acyltransferase n=1 Tax=Gordonia shandongensis TaxID=376351 RepID=UPI00040B35F3|nr:acyltransferase [Gordonia shandongensis]
MVNTEPKADDANGRHAPSATQEHGPRAHDGTHPNPEAPDPAPPVKKKDRHLYQIDFIRLFTFGGVILDHVILGLAPPAAMAAQGVGLMLRYTRYCFFALTGFVLTYQYRNRELHAPTFWRRRYKLIGLPFLMWSLFYWINRHYQRGGWDNVWGVFHDADTIKLGIKSLVYDLITGNAAYHLYFLSVSMQIYLVFPAVLWVLKRTWGYHRYLLAASGAFHIWLLFHMVRPPHAIFEPDFPVLGLIWKYLGVTLFPYQFFILAGCLAAMHFEAFKVFMRRFRAPLALLAVVTIAVTLWYFVENVNGGEEMFRATNVFMVHNAFALVGIIVLLWIAGSIWQDRRTPGSLPDRIMRTAADRSFGIYLAHVIVLSCVLQTSRAHLDKPLWLNLTLTYLVTVAVTVFVIEVLRRSPISMITTGRERIDWRIQNWPRSAAVGVVAIAVGILWRETMHTQLGALIAAAGALLILSAGVVAVRRLLDSDAETTVDV